MFTVDKSERYLWQELVFDLEHKNFYTLKTPVIYLSFHFRSY